MLQSLSRLGGSSFHARAFGCLVVGCLAVWAKGAAAELELDLAEDGWKLVNSSGDSVRLSRQAPEFDFGDCRLGGKAAGIAAWRKEESGREVRWSAEWRLALPRPATIRARLLLSRDEALLRKTVEVRLEDAASALLRSVLIDQVDAAGQTPVHQKGWQSYPVLGRSFFFGVEYPVASSKLDGERVQLEQAPGKLVPPHVWFRSHSAVYGAGERGQVREAFEGYISRLRPTPHGVHFNYNSWWTSPVPYTEADILAILEQFRRRLFEPYDTAFDSFTIDMGWAKNNTLWQVDSALFPQGFTAVAKACGALRSFPGLWISPSGVYGQALDLAWARSAGYEADVKACLGGPRYQAAFKQSLLELVTRYGLRQVKFDGYVPSCEATNHGHPAGALSVEPIADGIIDVFTSLRRAAPELWMEPTCFGFNPSPWWLSYCNSVIGSFGDDAPHGRVPCPDYRESYTTGRDYYNLKGARDILFPIAAQEVLGIIHQTDEPLQNDAMMTVLRGHQFLPLYINPKFMTDRRWEFLGSLLRWTRANESLLSHTRPLLPETWSREDRRLPLKDDLAAPREPYGYIHAEGGRALFGVRNPWVLPATLRIELRGSGLATTERLAAVALYPERGTMAPRVQATDILVVDLAPYETKVIELAPPRQPLPPPLEKGPVSSVRVQSVERCQLKIQTAGPRFGTNFTRVLDGEGPFLRVRFAASAQAAPGLTPQLLLLVEGKDVVSAPLGHLTVRRAGEPAGSGKPLPFRAVSSETGWRATGAPTPEHWLWCIADCPADASQIEGEFIVSDASQQISAYLVDRKEIGWQPQEKPANGALPPPEFAYKSGVELFKARLAADLPVITEDQPVERVTGVYLDVLRPLSVRQGWGQLQTNQSVWEKPLTLGGKRFVRGLGTHAPSRILYALDGKYRRFTAWAGADQATGPTITMAVRVDGKQPWESSLLTRESPAQCVEVDLTGARQLELMVGDGGNGLGADHADWADAVLWE